MEKKTLGGERLGTGKKMQVELKNYERSTHDLGYIWRSTTAAGTLVPFLCEVALPGDTFDIKLDVNVLTQPTIGPLFGSYKIQLDVFQAPIRLYNALLHNNMLKAGLDMTQVKLPQIILTAPGQTNDPPADLDNSQVNPSALLSYLGIRGVGITDTSTPRDRDFNAVAILMYYDTYKNYYANKQEELGAVIHTPTLNLTIDSITILDPDGSAHTLPAEGSPTGDIVMTQGSQIQIDYTGATPDPKTIYINTAETGDTQVGSLFQITSIGTAQILGTYLGGIENRTARYWRQIETLSPNITTFDLENLDAMRMAILSNPSTTAPFVVAGTGAILDIEPYNWLPNSLGTQEGLALKTYQSDLFNNWLNTEWINNINTTSAVSTVSGSFTMDALNIAKKVYDLQNRIAASDGTYDSWIDVAYAHEHYKKCETPMYMGGLQRELIFQSVISMVGNEQQPLGTLGGRGQVAQKKKGGEITIKIDEPSYIMGIFSLTPRIDYSQGNKWDTELQTLDDLHKPAFDQIGFEDLTTNKMAWWASSYNSTLNQWLTTSAGKQPAWINYMTNVNRCYGNFAVETNEMFMTLNRRYEPGNNLGGLIADVTTYIDPTKYNYIFAETRIDAQNFWVNIGVDMIARRKMSAKIMPAV